MYVEEQLLWQSFGDIIDPSVEVNITKDTIILSAAIILGVKGSSIIKGTYNLTNKHFMQIVTGTCIEGERAINSGVNFGSKALQHMQEPSRFVPISTLIETIKYGIANPDPRGSCAIMYTTEIYKNGKLYQLEVLYDEITNTIWHFMYY